MLFAELISKRMLAEASVVAMCFIWGATFIIVSAGLGDASTMVFIALRFALASIPVLYLYGPGCRRDFILPGILVGTLLFLGFATQTASLLYLLPAKTAFLTGLAVPLTVVINCAIQRRAPTLSEALSVALATVGTALLTHSDGGGGGSGGGDGGGGGGGVFGGGSGADGLGVAMGLACAVSFAFHFVSLNHFCEKDAGAGLATITVAQVILPAALAALAACTPLELRRFRPTPALGVAVAVCGLLATALAFSVFAWAQQHTTAPRCAVLCATEPIFAAITGWAVRGDALSGRAAAGAALIVMGTVVAAEVLPMPEAPKWLPERLRWAATKAPAEGGSGGGGGGAGAAGEGVQLLRYSALGEAIAGEDDEENDLDGTAGGGR